ncbi:hypothetical protein JHK87_040877 [Glycine soja]|nr:hypothetical protein JHK87_040877 [Glycine soja]
MAMNAAAMKKLSFSIPTAKPQSVDTSTTRKDDDSDGTKQYITEFDPSKPANPKITIPPIQNQWNPQQDNEHSTTRWRRTPEETELLRKLKLDEDLQRLPEDQGLEEFKDVPVEVFGEALLAGYGWTEGMGIGKKAKEDVKVVQVKGRTSREGLGFVANASGNNLNHCDHHLCNLQF